MLLFSIRKLLQSKSAHTLSPAIYYWITDSDKGRLKVGNTGKCQIKPTQYRYNGSIRSIPYLYQRTLSKATKNKFYKRFITIS